MANKQESAGYGSIYDRVFRENAQHIFIPLIEMQLGLRIKAYEALSEKLPKTIDREVDFLYQVQTQENKKALLHIEFQTKSEKDMIFRMQEYHALIQRKYKLPIWHVVIFLGKRKSSMMNQLDESYVFRFFQTINLYELDTEQLVSHQIPQVVLLALLSKYDAERSERLVRLVIRRLRQLAETPSEETKYLNQLLLLARLRNLEPLVTKIIEDMPIAYDVKKDSLFLRGVEKGMEKGEQKKEEEAILGFYKLGISVDQIAQALSISKDRVSEVLEEHLKAE